MQFVVVAVVLLLVGVAWHAQAFRNETRLASYNLDKEMFCSLECVQEILDDNCGGLECSEIEKIENHTGIVCVDECEAAILGTPMEQCMANNLPRRTDIDGLMEYIKFEFEYFCDGDLDAEESLLSIDEELEKDLI